MFGRKNNTRYDTHINMFPQPQPQVQPQQQTHTDTRAPYPIEDTTIGTLNQIPVFTAKPSQGSLGSRGSPTPEDSSHLHMNSSHSHMNSGHVHMNSGIVNGSSSSSSSRSGHESGSASGNTRLSTKDSNTVEEDARYNLPFLLKKATLDEVPKDTEIPETILRPNVEVRADNNPFRQVMNEDLIAPPPPYEEKDKETNVLREKMYRSESSDSTKGRGIISDSTESKKSISPEKEKESIRNRDLASYSTEALTFYEVYNDVVADQGQFTPKVQLKWCETLLEFVFKENFISHYNINAEKLKRELRPEEAQKNQKVILEHAFKVLKKLIASRYAPAIYLMGTLYSHQPYLEIKNKNIVTRNDQKALEFYCKSAALNHSDSCYRAGVCFEFQRGTPSELSKYQCLEKAFQYYRQGAQECNNTSCMYKLGMTHLHGLQIMNYTNDNDDPRELDRIIRQDIARSIFWFEKAADLGTSPQACYELGKIYEFSNMPLNIQTLLLEHGVHRDTAQALRYYRECATRHNYPLAQWKLGHCYEIGELNLARDPAKSIAWYYRSANGGNIAGTKNHPSNSGASNTPMHGNPMAMLALSGWCLTGASGVMQPNDKEALKWALRASEQSDHKLARAEYVLGRMYELGLGTQPDLSKARSYYNTAAQHGFPKAIQRLTK